MTDTIIGGAFKLASGVRLIERDKGGIVFQSSPLRAMRVNGMAFDILQQCHETFSPRAIMSSASVGDTAPILSFLDSLCAKHLVQWTPEKEEPSRFVSIVVPVYNRREEIGECIESLLHLNYPASRREIIIVDDSSDDDTAAVVREYGVKLIIQERNSGQSAARNAGVAAAAGEIIAFIDSDCIADPNWLHELTPYFQDPRIAMVGGYVASHYRKTWLDRYEEAKSPLNMGENTITCQSADSEFYVPTCNMLVRKDAYWEVAGLDETWRVGEDVDLCWKLKKANHRLVYVPEGRVSHKHRNRFPGVFNRRFDYGTSEPVLYERHREASKRFPWQPAGFLFCFFCCLGLLTRPLLFSVMSFVVVTAEAFRNRAEIAKKAGFLLDFLEVWKATFNNCTSLAYYLCLHLVRYYFLLFIPLIFLVPASAPLLLCIVLFPAVVQFVRIRPCLPFSLFIFFFLMEQAFYQAGVFLSCLKIRSFRCYRLCLSGRGGLKEKTTLMPQRKKTWSDKRWSGKVLWRQPQ